MRMLTAGISLLPLLTTVATAVQGAPKPVPPSPYLGVVYRYADAMLKHGRDTHGPQKTGLLLSALDRTTLAPLNGRPIADPQLDQNLLRVLYTLSELSGKATYRDAADAQLKWLIANAASPDVRVALWDAGSAWNVLADRTIPGGRMAGGPDAEGDTVGGPLRPWMVWERCFVLAPDASKLLVLGLQQSPTGEPRSPRRAGFRIRAFSIAYQQTGDRTLLKAIDAELGQLEATPEDLPAGSLSAAIDCGGAASRVPETLVKRLRAFAARQDQSFCALPHDLKTKGGFALGPGKVAARPDGLTPLWVPRQDGHTTAMRAMMCVARYENTGDVRYRNLIHAAADAYRNSLPPDDADVWPMTFGHVISLQLAAWRSTANQEYLDTAGRLADLALQRFWADGPLPRAGTKVAHYDTATGADTLALALVELHLSILHITAVRCPPNTIDR